jgi:uncharacterized surface protein with fasciclin (FAS1) repeats
MKPRFATIISLAVLTASLSLAALKPAPKADIVDTAAGAKGFSTLVAAVKAAGLVDALKGRGPFTVFGPTDAAFEKLEKSKPGTLAMLLKPENKETLVKILTYHVVPGKVMASDVVKLKNGSAVKTLNGASITVHNKKGVKVDKANVVKTDILCSNGVIHVIDTVILPK